MMIAALEIGIDAHRSALCDLPKDCNDRPKSKRQNRTKRLAAPFLSGHLVKNRPRDPDRTETKQNDRHQFQTFANDVRQIPCITRKDRTLCENRLIEKKTDREHQKDGKSHFSI